jgi:hypothetical protein
MRRVLLVLTIIALMAAMMVSGGPAMAQDSFGNETNFNNSWDVVQYNDDYYFGFDDAWDDCYWWYGAYWC